MTVEKIVERALTKSEDSSEAKTVGAFVKDILDEEPGNYELVTAAMDAMMHWCREFREAAMRQR